METALTSFSATFSAKRTGAGSFLIEDLLPSEVFTPEDFSEEQKQIAAVTSHFGMSRSWR